jgi:hypothetical protein
MAFNFTFNDEIFSGFDSFLNTKLVINAEIKAQKEIRTKALVNGSIKPSTANNNGEIKSKKAIIAYYRLLRLALIFSSLKVYE